MPSRRLPSLSKPGLHLILALGLIAALWGLGSWAVRQERIEWAMVALVAIVFAWAYAGWAYLCWVKK